MMAAYPLAGTLKVRSPVGRHVHGIKHGIIGPLPQMAVFFGPHVAAEASQFKTQFKIILNAKIRVQFRFAVVMGDSVPETATTAPHFDYFSKMFPAIHAYSSIYIK
jgi:hypothetical protein